MTTLFDTITSHDLARFDTLDLAGLSLTEIANLLRDHGAAHLNQIERIELAEQLTRRRFIIGAGALGLGVLTGCGPQEQAAVPTSSPTTKQVKDMYGDVEVPAEPQRVYCTYDDVLVSAIALGFSIVGGPGERGKAANPFPAFLTPDQVAGITKFDFYPTPNLEQLAALKPDLVLNTVPDPEYVANFKGIAPVFSYDVYGAAGWRAGFQMLADTFNRAQLAQDWLARLDARAAQLKTTLQTNPPRSFALGSVTEDGSLGVWLVQPAYAVMIDQVGFVEASFAAGKRGEDVILSAELIPTVDADIFMFIDYGPETVTARETLVQSPLWPQGITTFAVNSAEMYPAPQAFLALFDSVEKALT
jgi:iron complex transport system substrate-binding protein